MTKILKECECGTEGCTRSKNGKCCICQENYEDLCEACEEAISYSDAYLDAYDPEHEEIDLSDIDDGADYDYDFWS